MHLLRVMTASEISDITLDLDEYIKGGTDNDHKQLREGYGHDPQTSGKKN